MKMIRKRKATTIKSVQTTDESGGGEAFAKYDFEEVIEESEDVEEEYIPSPLVAPVTKVLQKVYENDPLKIKLENIIYGQDHVIEEVIPFINSFLCGLNIPDRPIGNICLLGPTGSGKTRLCEALAEVLHGSPKNMIKIDCGEFQMEHEVAKLVGAPPGYLGHRETQPMLTQAKINGAASAESDLSIILFDEIEKAAPSMHKIMLGIMDKAMLRLGDNTTVNFERCLIFMTSNLGVTAMNKILNPDFGFKSSLVVDSEKVIETEYSRLKDIGVGALKKKFSPEFINRIDATAVYKPLDNSAFNKILINIFKEFNNLIANRLGIKGFEISATAAAKTKLLADGTSLEYGARNLKRVIKKELFNPLYSSICQGKIPPGSFVTLAVDSESGNFNLLHTY